MGNQQIEKLSVHDTLKLNDPAILQQLIQIGKNINEVNSQGESLLRRSLYQGNLPYVKLLCQHKALIIPPLSFNQTMLHLAVFLENFELIKWLLQHNASNTQFNNAQDDYGITALHMAFAKNNPKIVKLLIDNGCSPYVKNHNQQSVIDIASANQFTEHSKVSNLILRKFNEREAQLATERGSVDSETSFEFAAGVGLSLSQVIGTPGSFHQRSKLSFDSSFREIGSIKQIKFQNLNIVDLLHKCDNYEVQKGVYKGRHIIIKKVKLNNNRLAQDLLRNEIQNTNDIKLRAVCACRGVCFGILHTSAVFEFFSGKPLTKILELPIGVTNLLKICYNLASSLQKLTQSGQIFYNLSPKNVLVNTQFIVRLIGLNYPSNKNYDFSNKLNDCITKENISFLSPEMIRGDQNISSSSQIWNFGTIMLYIFTKQKLQSQCSAKAIKDILRSTNFRYPAINKLIYSCLQYEPDKRIPLAFLIQQLLNFQKV